MLTNLLATLALVVLGFSSPVHGWEQHGDPSTAIIVANESPSGVSATERPTEAIVEPSPYSSKAGNSGDTTSSQDIDNERVLTARLRGSLCPSCLIQLEKKLQSVNGIKSARVIRPAKNGGAIVNEPSYAQVEVIYKSSKLNQKKIRKIIQQNDFDIRKEKDEILTEQYKSIPNPY